MFEELRRKLKLLRTPEWALSKPPSPPDPNNPIVPSKFSALAPEPPQPQGGGSLNPSALTTFANELKTTEAVMNPKPLENPTQVGDAKRLLKKKGKLINDVNTTQPFGGA